MRWLLNLLYNRTTRKVIGTLYIVVLPAALGVLLHELGFGPIPLIIIEVFVTSFVILLVEGVLASSGAIALISANDLAFSIIISLVMIGLAFVAPFQQPSIVEVLTEHTIPPIAEIIVYFLLGIFLGATLRRMLADLFARVIFGRSRFVASLSFTEIWFLTAAIALLSFQTNVISPYLTGVGVGVFLNRSMAFRLERAGAASRRLFEVQSNIPKKLPLSEDDRTALQLLARGRDPLTMRFTALTQHIEECKRRSSMTPCLRIVSACAARLEARYADAVAETDGTENPPSDSLDAQLLLIRALSLEDKENVPDSEIDALLNTVASSAPGRDCPLTRALQARRAAEGTINAQGIISISRKPLDLVVTSLELRQRTSTLLEETHPIIPQDEGAKFFRGLIAHGVPVTPSWLLDVFGYALLVAGCPEEGRVFLQRCISLDPAYSYGYLHLGDYFLFQRTLRQKGRHGANSAKKRGSWNAEVCYKLAMKVERNASSRVKRIAQQRLELLDQLEPD